MRHLILFLRNADLRLLVSKRHEGPPPRRPPYAARRANIAHDRQALERLRAQLELLAELRAKPVIQLGTTRPR